MYNELRAEIGFDFEMKIINTSNNTVYVEDLDMHLPYRDGEIEEISPNDLRKSRCLRNYVLSGMLNVVEYDPEERIEASLMYMKQKIEDKKKAKEDEHKDEVLPEPELDKCSDDIEVKIHGIFLDSGGYAKVNRNLALKLHEAGFKVKTDPKRSQNQLNKDELEPIIKLQQTQLSRKHILIDSIIPSFSEMSTGRYKILYSTIESYTVPQQFIDCCENYNEIWLTSKWSASVLRKLIDRPVYDICTGVDNTLYTENGPRFDFGSKIKDFVFISVFGWNYRKGYDVLLKAYFDEFSADDNVSLILMSKYQGGIRKDHKGKISADIDKIMEQFPNKDLPHVARYHRNLPEKDMPQLYRAADCFILTSRGEGGCLPPLEASLCGLPIIMTNCSGQQGYLRADNSYMIEIDRLVEMQTGRMNLHYWDGQEFPDLTSPEVHHQTRQAMRSVVSDYGEAKKRNRNLQKLILNKFTWTHTVNAASIRLHDIKKKMEG